MDGPAILLFIAIGTLSLLVYFVPTMVAVYRRSSRLAPIILINVCLGWLGLGWLLALGIALWPEQPTYVHHHHYGERS